MLMSPSKMILGGMALLLNLGFCLPTQARQIVISVADQKLALLDKGQTLDVWPVSTSKYGVGDRFGSYATPIGNLRVAQKIGSGAPQGTVFKSRKPTGEILAPHTRGRDPVITRILWLQGTESQNRHAWDRCIYIHGTAEEYKIGRPASYGCIRMKSRDVTRLFDAIGLGTPVIITSTKLEKEIQHLSKLTGNATCSSFDDTP
jgi:lipoprotein-anchoring transpeptidase ErfK/SrfK